MRIRLWNAFASNNSGSYTIVGSFEDVGAAEGLAAEINPVLIEQSAWLAEPQRTAPSPFHRLLSDNAIEPASFGGDDDDWPDEWSGPPQIAAIGRQIVLHCDYTVSMPRELGALIYRRGGRVDVELDHSHAPTVAIFDLWVNWEERRRDEGGSSARLRRVFDNLMQGPLTENRANPAIEPAAGLAEHGTLRFGAVFDDLIAGVRSVTAAADAEGLERRVRFHEAIGTSGDPLADLRKLR